MNKTEGMTSYEIRYCTGIMDKYNISQMTFLSEKNILTPLNDCTALLKHITTAIPDLKALYTLLVVD